MTPIPAPDGARQGRLEEVLVEYMQRQDRGEAVDREQILARHPELAEELQSYFAGCDEIELFGRRATPGPATEPHSRDSVDGTPEEGNAGQFGDYELLERIGEGGMGVIFKARQRGLQRLVALKMIRPDRVDSPEDVIRFRSEAEAVASLDHPNVVPIYEVGEYHDQPFFSMKLVVGGNLAQQLPRLAPDLRAGAAILAAVARAVHYAHQRGLLHRDLKPANVLIDTDGQPYVTDFGLAQRLERDSRLTQTGAILGTPSYMPPEQASGQKGLTTAVDTYALGAILYELLTGRPPFRAETPLQTLKQLLEQEPTPPRSLNPRVDRDLETVCLKCLQKLPHQRYPSAEALADDLGRWLRGEPVRARPISRRQRVLMWVRRRPHLAALALLLVVALVAGFSGVCWQWLRAEQERQKAAKLAEAEGRTAYARAISLGYAEWRAGNVGPAEQVLSACPEELREWEWHYLRRLFRVRQLTTLPGHQEGVLAVAFSPDGARVASADADGVVKVWDRRVARPALTLRGHVGAVTAVTFSPDGKSLASGGADRTVRIWETTSGKVLATLRGHAAGVTGLAFDPQGQRLASTAGERLSGELKLWDPAQGEALIGRACDTLLSAVAFSPDGKSLATAGHDGNVSTWSATTLKPGRLFQGRTERTVPWTSVAFSADGRWVAAGSPEGVVRVWVAATGQEFFSALTPTQAGVSGLAFAGPDGRMLVAATADNTAQGWFTRSGKPAFTLRGHTQAVRAVACSPDGRCLATASLDRTVKLWDLGRRDDDLTLRGPNQGVTSVAFTPDGTRLASATRDHALKVWDVATGKATSTRWLLPEAVNGLAFSPDGRSLAGAGEDGTVRLWDTAGREVAAFSGHQGRVRAVAFRADGRLASAGEDGTVRVWEVPSGRERLCLSGHRGPVHATAFSPDGRLLASAGEDGVVRLWDAATGRQVRTLDGHRRPVYAAAFSPDGRHLSTAGQDGLVLVWDATTGALALTLRGHAGAVRCLAYGPQGRLASAGDDMAVRVWDSDGRELLALRGHTEALCTVGFSRDGHRLASAGDDGMIKIWDGTPLDTAPEDRPRQPAESGG